MNRAKFEAILSALGTFFGVLLIVAFAIAVGSKGALKGPDAFVLRWTVISLMVAFSALIAWLRWRFFLSPRLSPAPAAVAAPRSAERMTAAAQPSLRVQAVNPPPARARPSADVMAAWKQAIVFRQHFPPRHDRSWLCFFGGAPVAARGFEWPRPAGSGTPGKPFNFLMQIDCAEVPASARLRMLPDEGVLYFFHDLTWSQPDAFRVLYETGDVKQWSAIQPPDDLGVAFGEHARHQWKWPRSAQDCPKLLPKWTFQPIAIEIPSDYVRRAQEEEEGGPVLWPGEKIIGEVLRRAQGEDVPSTWFTVKDFIAADGAIRRPFDNYPHDWRAVQICSGLILHTVRDRYSLPSTHALRELSEGERNALVARIGDEAQNFYSRAASHPSFAPVPRAERDEFWSWLADKAWLVRFVMTEAMTMSIEASLIESQEAAARIPADVVRRVHSRHALAVQSERGLFASEPDRMLAPPVDVQGHQWDRAKTHLLLLELSSNQGLGHHFGEGVYQFWITPEDLKARRFDKVELTADAY